MPAQDRIRQAHRRFLQVLYGCGIASFMLWMVACSSFSTGENRSYTVTDFGAKGDSVTVNTVAIQRAIDQCAVEGGGTVVIPEGVFLSGALFLKENVTLEISEKAVLKAIAGTENYPVLKNTRIAGIEMDWPSAFINVLDTRNVTISGKGVIDGSGYFWWADYWTKRDSLLSTVPPDLVDWYVPRPRLLLFHQASDSEVKDVRLQNSAFWTVHICYSQRIDVTGLTINNPVLGEGKKAASSDGVDVDSSRDIFIRKCSIAVDDDCIAVKSGRGSDGLRVNIPTENVVIEDCVFGTGHGGVSMGTETAGGIRNVYVRNCVAKGNRAPIKFKPRAGRGGVVENITHDGWQIEQAGTVIDYAYRQVNGEDYIDEWQKVKVPFEKATPRYRNITLRNIKAEGAKESVRFLAWPLAHAENVILENVQIKAEAGAVFQYVDNLLLKDVEIEAPGEAVEFRNVSSKVE